MAEKIGAASKRAGGGCCAAEDRQEEQRTLASSSPQSERMINGSGGCCGGGKGQEGQKSQIDVGGQYQPLPSEGEEVACCGVKDSCCGKEEEGVCCGTDSSLDGPASDASGKNPEASRCCAPSTSESSCCPPSNELECADNRPSAACGSGKAAPSYGAVPAARALPAARASSCCEAGNGPDASVAPTSCCASQSTCCPEETTLVKKGQCCAPSSSSGTCCPATSTGPGSNTGKSSPQATAPSSCCTPKPTSAACSSKSGKGGCETSKKASRDARGSSCCAPLKTKVVSVKSCCREDLEKGRDCESAPLLGPAKNKEKIRTYGSTTPDGDSKHLVLAIKGMTCKGCADMVVDHLSSVDGITSVSVTFMNEKADLSYLPTVITSSQINEEVVKLGFGVETLADGEGIPLRFSVQSSKLEKVLAKLRLTPGVEDPKCSKSGAVRSLIDLRVSPSMIGSRELLDEVKRMDSAASFVASWRAKKAGGSSEQIDNLFHTLLLSALLALPIVIFYFVLPTFDSSWAWEQKEVGHGLSYRDLVGLVFSTPILFYCGLPLHRGAITALRYTKKANMDVLVSLAAIVAYVYSVGCLLYGLAGYQTSETFFESCAMLVVLVLLARYLEVRIKHRASKILEEMSETQCPSALLVLANEAALKAEPDLHQLTTCEVQDIDRELIQVKDVLKVLPGAMVPTDGMVLWGSSDVDEHILTGESRPVHKAPGDLVFGGSVNHYSVLYIRTTRTVHQTLLGQIVSAVEEAQKVAPSTDRLADVLAGYITTMALCLSIVCFVVWFFLGKYKLISTSNMAPFSFALRFAVSVLVVSCPCAFQLASPSAVMVGTALAARSGMLIKGGDVLERASKATTVVFDKTGTLTEKELAVVEAWVSGLERTDFWRSVLAAERQSEHPIALAIQRHCSQELGDLLGSQPPATVGEFLAHPGHGIKAATDSRNWVVGSRGFLADQGVELGGEAVRRYEGYSRQGCTIVCVAVDSLLVGMIALRSVMKLEVRSCIKELISQGMDCYIVSGDSQGACDALARQVEINTENVFGEKKPKEKVKIVQRLEAEGKLVVFVGDGVNDAESLVQADVGIAMASGTDIAMQAGDVVLLRSNMEEVVSVLSLSRRTMGIIKLNFAWAIGYNVLAVPLSLGLLFPLTGLYIPPTLAGLSEVMSSLPVILFSLLIQRWRPYRV